MLAIALEQIIHLRFDNLLNVRFFDIIRSDIKADPQGANYDDAEYCKRQRDTQAQASLKPGHVSPTGSRGREQFLSDHSLLPASRRGAVRAYDCEEYRWFPAHPPTLPTRVPCG